MKLCSKWKWMHTEYQNSRAEWKRRNLRRRIRYHDKYGCKICRNKKSGG